ncbi:glycosyltransferase [Photobacterium sanctipauli]|uniref:Glycosyltransferase n=1 Tax=Photobacterium sanctipauli TaxID=1342794 RepID=A0A2T3NPH5_9GAMM|nr:glycosyltransferase [Photobacterium sanctipauli]PSW18151.1 glycosyltransferase [Photobacterium sanctipauli]
MTASEKIVHTALNEASDYFDLTDSSHQKRLLALANTLYCLKDISNSYYQELLAKQQCPLEFRLAVKLVESRRYILKLTKPVTVGVVFAMWGEHNRLNEKNVTNPNGEDSLRVKINQLNWVTQGTVVDWHLYPVDDGCPHGSANIAEGILNDHPDKQKVTVLRLADALPAESGPLSNLASADDSRKGGAIIYGCDQAIKDGADCVMYTDADNSVHLGQLGLLLKPYVSDNAQVVLGNRKHQDSILVKQEERWGVGIKTLRHMQRMLGRAIFSNGIKDTQAAFKLYDKQVIKDILVAPSVYDFSFDTDWIFAAMKGDYDLQTVPFAFIDSAAESASIVQGPMTTWYTLLSGLVKAAQDRDVDHNIHMAAIFDEQIKSHKDLELIIDILPPALAEIDDQLLGDPLVFSPTELEAWLEEIKQADVATVS